MIFFFPIKPYTSVPLACLLNQVNIVQDIYLFSVSICI